MNSILKRKLGATAFFAVLPFAVLGVSYFIFNFGPVHAMLTNHSYPFLCEPQGPAQMDPRAVFATALHSARLFLVGALFSAGCIFVYCKPKFMLPALSVFLLFFFESRVIITPIAYGKLFARDPYFPVFILIVSAIPAVIWLVMRKIKAKRNARHQDAE